MPIATGLALGLGALVAGGSIAGAAISSHGANEAAKTQANAATSAEQLQAEEQDKALAFEKQQWETNQANLAPWLSAGRSSLTNLEALLGIGGNRGTPGYGSLAAPFVPPTLQDAENEPGYQFARDQGEQAMENSAAAKGNLISGNTQEALDKWASQFAESNYTNVYDRAFNTFETNQATKYNRLAALAGLGQTTATTLGTEGNQTGSTIANIDLTGGAQIGQDIQNAGAATASGYAAGANAWGGALSGTTNNLMTLLLLSKLGGGGGGGFQPMQYT